MGIDHDFYHDQDLEARTAWLASLERARALGTQHRWDSMPPRKG